MKFLGTKDQRKQSGVYIIRNAINNRIYVGSAKVFTDRYWKHRSTLMTGKHRSPQLHAVGLNRKLRGERKNNTPFILV